MARRLVTMLVLAAALAGWAASATPSASAVTWTSNGSAGGTAFTATSPAAKFTVNSSPAVAISCSNSSMTGVEYGPGPNALTVKWQDMTPAFSSCTAAGLAASITCGASAWAAFAASVTSGGVTSVSLKAAAGASFFCSVTIPSLPGCTITFGASGGAGAAFAAASYDNALKALAVLATSQTIFASWTSGCTMFSPRPGSASASLTTWAGASLLFTLTSAFKSFLTGS
jgi:hypothetical protein